jgi:cytosine/adenosine deaminase-related metal-dependent hydrolase
MNSSPEPTGCQLYSGQLLADGHQTWLSDGAILMRDGVVVECGASSDLKQTAPADTTHHHLPNALLIPGLVNAHAHLDLTAVGAVEFDGEFVDWVSRIISIRPDGHAAIASSINLGIQKSLDAGVLTIGDICGSVMAYETLKNSDLRGVGFYEMFGIGELPDDWAESMQGLESRWDEERIRFGLQPHAPYSAGPSLYRLAAQIATKSAVPLCTHLAETSQELQFVAEGNGPFRDMLERMGRWRDHYLEHYHDNLHPIDWLYSKVFGTDKDSGRNEAPGRWLLAHCNYATETRIATLAAAGASVAYCPRASNYFEHRNHPYRQMISAGVNVCLGTDSILCHGDLSILEEMRYLKRTDDLSAKISLQMATGNGLEALGFDRLGATFESGQTPGLLALSCDGPIGPDALDHLLSTDADIDIRVLENAGSLQPATDLESD